MDENAINEHALGVGKVFTWHECNVPDAAKAKEFYGNVLDWEYETMPMGGDMGDYTMIKANGKTVAGIMPTVGDYAHVPPHWSVYIAVDDVDARAALVTENGGQIVVPAFSIPGVGRMCLCQDNQASHFWLFTGG